MRTNIFPLFLALLLPLAVLSQEKQNPYHLKIVSTYDGYQGEVKQNDNNRLVNLEEAIPGIRLDIRYATDDNFTHRKVYSSACAYLRKPAARALAEVQAELTGEGLGLKVFDAYRPYSATLLFYEVVKDTLFVASPLKGSRHNRGCAVDLSLIDLSTGKEIEMPTEYDDFSAKAGPSFTDLPEKVKVNRDKLIRIMQRHGFTVYPSEWWHFDFTGWDGYGLMDISFEELEGQ